MNWTLFFSPDAKAGHKRYALHAQALCVLFFVLAGCEEEVPKLPAPEISLELFDGGSFSLSEHKGRVVVINFFASWCIPCKAEAPALDKVYREYKTKNVAFLGIAMQDTKSKAMGFIEETGVSFPAGLDYNNKIKEAFGVYGIPATYFIDKDGKINYTHAGMLTEDLIRYELDKIL